MSVQYMGAHGITFRNEREDVGEDKTWKQREMHTWTDLFLIPATAPTIAIYEPSLSIVSIPGTSRVIDMSEALSGSVGIGRRTGEWQFIADTERYSEALSNQIAYHRLSTRILRRTMGFLHGKWLKVKLDDYPSEWYSGRIYVKDFKIDKNYSTISLAYNLDIAGTTMIANGPT